MKTRREVLKTIAKQGNCEGIKCFDCPYYEGKCPDSEIIKRIGAMAILRMFPEVEENSKTSCIYCEYYTTCYKLRYDRSVYDKGCEDFERDEFYTELSEGEIYV